MKIKNREGQVLGEIELTPNENMLLESLCSSEDGARAVGRMLARFYCEGHAAGVASTSSPHAHDDSDLIDEDPDEEEVDAS